MVFSSLPGFGIGFVLAGMSAVSVGVGSSTVPSSSSKDSPSSARSGGASVVSGAGLGGASVILAQVSLLALGALAQLERHRANVWLLTCIGCKSGVDVSSKSGWGDSILRKASLSSSRLLVDWILKPCYEPALDGRRTEAD